MSDPVSKHTHLERRLKMEKKELTKEELEKLKEESKMTIEEMDEVAGGGVFDDVPRVKEHDYTDSVKKRV